MPLQGAFCHVVPVLLAVVPLAAVPLLAVVTSWLVVLSLLELLPLYPSAALYCAHASTHALKLRVTMPLRPVLVPSPISSTLLPAVLLSVSLTLTVVFDEVEESPLAAAHPAGQSIPQGFTSFCVSLLEGVKIRVVALLAGQARLLWAVAFKGVVGGAGLDVLRGWCVSLVCFQGLAGLS